MKTYERNKQTDYFSKDKLDATTDSYTALSLYWYLTNVDKFYKCVLYADDTMIIIVIRTITLFTVS